MMNERGSKWYQKAGENKRGSECYQKMSECGGGMLSESEEYH